MTLADATKTACNRTLAENEIAWIFRLAPEAEAHLVVGGGDLTEATRRARCLVPTASFRLAVHPER
jgi:hypothetical protein